MTFSRRQPGARTAFSLVETLVAMVILVAGILVVLRAFPAGFGVLRAAESRTLAQALGQAALQGTKARGNNLASGIFPANPNNPDEVLQDISPLPLVEGADRRYSDLNAFRRIIGETTKVPAPTTESPYATGGQAVSLYTLGASPISDTFPDPFDGSPNPDDGIAQHVVIYDARPLERIVWLSPPAPTAADWDLLSPFQYIIDYRGNGNEPPRLYFKPVPYDRYFKVEYSYYQAAGSVFRANAVPDLVARVPAGSANTEVNLPVGPGLMEEESESIYPAYRQIDSAMAFSDSMYEFKVLNPHLGLIGFNPLGAFYRSPEARDRGLVVRIDYDVYDWHILSEGRVVSQSGPFAVKTTLRRILNIGTLRDDRQPYTGLTEQLRGIDVLIVDVATGRTMDSRDFAGQSAFQNGSIDYQDGIINFNATGEVNWRGPNGTQIAQAEPIAGRAIRVYYRANGEWGLAFQKAYSLYHKETSGDPQQLAFREYLPANRPLSQGGAPQGGFLYFRHIDAGNGVIVDYNWTDPDTGVTRTVMGEMHRITEQPEIVNNTPFVGLKLREVPAGAGFDVLNVRGASFRVRVIWRENNRWRVQDIDSALTRTGV